MRHKSILLALAVGRSCEMKTISSVSLIVEANVHQTHFVVDTGNTVNGLWRRIFTRQLAASAVCGCLLFCMCPRLTCAALHLKSLACAAPHFLPSRQLCFRD